MIEYLVPLVNLQRKKSTGNRSDNVLKAKSMGKSMRSSVQRENVAIQEILKILVNDNYKFVKVVLDIPMMSDSDAVARVLLFLHVRKGSGIEFLRFVISKELGKMKDSSEVLLNTSMAARMLQSHSKLIGSNYLKGTLGETVRSLYADRDFVPFELDPASIRGDALEENIQIAYSVTQRFIDCIFDSIHLAPLSMRILAKHIKLEVANRYPNESVRILGRYFYELFFFPALETLQRYGLLNEAPTFAFRRSMVLVARILLYVSQGTVVPEKDYLKVMNEFIVSYHPAVLWFYDRFCDVQVDTDNNSIDIPDGAIEAALTKTIRYIETGLSNLELDTYDFETRDQIEVFVAYGAFIGRK